MNLTLAELHQAASSITDGDALLTILSSPAFWGLAIVSLLALIGSKLLKKSTKTQNILAAVVLVFVAVGATLALPVSGAWVAKQGDLAKKSAAYLGWKRTDADTFNRFEVLTMKRDMIHDAEVADSVIAGVVKKGGVAKDAEPAVMGAMTLLHHTQLAKTIEGPAKAISDAEAAAAKAAKPVAGAPVAESPAKAASK